MNQHNGLSRSEVFVLDIDACRVFFIGSNVTQILHQSGETPKAPIMGVRKEHQNKNRSQ
jgi:hypothetical protein